MKTLQKAVVLLLLLSLLEAVGAAPLCASCGPKMMDCCKGEPARAESLDRAACCEFRMSVTAEPHPARTNSFDSRFQSEETLLTVAQVALLSIPAAGARENPALSDYSFKDTSPPLFLLNSSLLC